MVLIYCLMCAIFAVIGKLQYKRVVNPVTLLNAMWVLVFALVPVSTYVGVDYPSNLAVNMCGLGVLTMTIGMFAGSKFKIKQFSHSVGSEVSTKWLHVFVVVSVALSLVSGIDAIHLILSGVPLSAIRENYFTAESSGNVLLYYARNYIGLPLQYVLLVAGISELAKSKKDKFLLAGAIISTALSVVESGGRYIMVNAVYAMIALYGLHSERFSKATKRKIAVGAVVLVVFVLMITSQRQVSVVKGEDNWFKSTLDTIYIYFSSNITYFGKLVQRYPLQTYATHGFSFLTGFFTVFLALFSFLNIIPYPAQASFVGNATAASLWIGSSYGHNALPTAFYYMYMDFGVFGVILESLLLGYFFMRCYQNYMQSKEWKWRSFYILSVILILNTPLKNLLYSPTFALPFVYFSLACHKRRQ